MFYEFSLKRHESGDDYFLYRRARREERASAEDIARTCHAYPTLGEAIKEAVLAGYGRAIHIRKIVQKNGRDVM